MRLEISPNWRVRAITWADVPLPASVVWGQMRGLRRFLTADPLHVGVTFADSANEHFPPIGGALVIHHRMFGVAIDRVGKLLSWKEGVGFAVSDLSQRGKDVGFPHVCGYEAKAVDAGHSRITLSACGRWTARWVPRPVIKLWLWWVMAETRRSVEAEMRRFAKWRSSQRALVPQK